MACLRIRIENGCTTAIWGTPWIPDDGAFRVFTKRPVHTAEPDSVSQFIDPVTFSWKESLIRAVFWPIDAEIILRIPLGDLRAEDRWVLHYSKSGFFSIRSCYHLLHNVWGHSSKNAEGSSSGACMINWKWFGSFMFLPKGGIIDNPCCPFCDLAYESTVRAIRDCPNIQHCWNIEEFDGCNLALDQQRFTAWIQCLQANLNTFSLEFAVVLCWAIWNGRNKVLFGNHDSTPIDPNSRSFHPTVNGKSFVDAACLWEPPNHGYIKINFDWWRETKREIVFGGSLTPRTDFLTRNLRKLKPLVWPSNWQSARGWQKVHIEADCAKVIKALQMEEHNLSSMGVVIDDCSSISAHILIINLHSTINPQILIINLHNTINAHILIINLHITIDATVLLISVDNFTFKNRVQFKLFPVKLPPLNLFLICIFTRRRINFTFTVDPGYPLGLCHLEPLFNIMRGYPVLGCSISIVGWITIVINRR
ncbi:hypothetical protein CDL12_19692 [Handroanthus impetiginosus]|uniref:Reverse transcriptase zinc-binding domain-containing protein n=1 Tax=Handroanthus impetiginosus TaxID=429701 RepID=A0A2G9GRV6_9LAMI|nr:hypothetical protein CDL12_19692 [Handroanthus impetiginosus]